MYVCSVLRLENQGQRGGETLPSPGHDGPEMAEECLGENQTLTQGWVGLLLSVEWLFPPIKFFLCHAQVDSSRYSCEGMDLFKHLIIISPNSRESG